VGVLREPGGEDGKKDWIHNLDWRGAGNVSAMDEDKSSSVDSLCYLTHRRWYRWVDGKIMGRVCVMPGKEISYTVKFIRVKWRDSCILHDQQLVDADFSVAIMESVGFLLQEDDTKIVLAGELLETGYARRIIVIPKENIVMQAENTGWKKRAAKK
jgi:hypothetical protein